MSKQEFQELVKNYFCFWSLISQFLVDNLLFCYLEPITEAKNIRKTLLMSNTRKLARTCKFSCKHCKFSAMISNIKCFQFVYFDNIIINFTWRTIDVWVSIPRQLIFYLLNILDLRSRQVLKLIHFLPNYTWRFLHSHSLIIY